ncbi:hypothetical protein TKK_0018094 [Trichogramma kaykai]|uniref:Lipid-binding serum glycoprotein N-terminal domain-containing protein n=1 Tax=Trichogramma kaykai TaxID=54128 RepID=A0ABD2W0D4_9HYME
MIRIEKYAAHRNFVFAICTLLHFEFVIGVQAAQVLCNDNGFVDSLLEKIALALSDKEPGVLPLQNVTGPLNIEVLGGDFELINGKFSDLNNLRRVKNVECVSEQPLTAFSLTTVKFSLEFTVAIPHAKINYEKIRVTTPIFEFIGKDIQLEVQHFVLHMVIDSNHKGMGSTSLREMHCRFSPKTVVTISSLPDICLGKIIKSRLVERLPKIIEDDFKAAFAKLENP